MSSVQETREEVLASVRGLAHVFEARVSKYSLYVRALVLELVSKIASHPSRPASKRLYYKSLRLRTIHTLNHLPSSN